jgi:hypothetical protein
LLSPDHSWDDWIRCYDDDGTKTFSVSKSGALTAIKGLIGGWTITENGIRSIVTNKQGRRSTVGIYNYENYWANSDETKVSDVIVISDYVPSGTGGETTYPFVLKKDGSLIATKVTIEGKITSTEGKIGGWTIAENHIASAKDSSNYFYMYGLDSTSNYWLRCRALNEETFSVTRDGTLTATKANITGKIAAESGEIGGLSIAEDENGNKCLILVDDESTLFKVATAKEAYFFGTSIKTGIVF